MIIQDFYKICKEERIGCGDGTFKLTCFSICLIMVFNYDEREAYP